LQTQGHAQIYICGQLEDYSLLSRNEKAAKLVHDVRVYRGMKLITGHNFYVRKLYSPQNGGTKLQNIRTKIKKNENVLQS
jgi:hypothetical protein